jgi:hypothetical protein
MLGLATTDNKVAIRRTWDKPIINGFYQQIGRKLSYFGLPGPDIRDFIDWGEFLGWKIGVEFISARSQDQNEQKKKINKLQTNIMLQGFNNEWELRRGSLEDIVMEYTDIDGKKPAKLILEPGRKPRMEYELHNWDFQGGLGYRTKKGEEAKRIEAIKTCIALQKNHAFIFFLTLNVRHTLGDELMVYLEKQADELQSIEHKEILHWYAQQGTKHGTEHLRLKAVVPLFIRKVSEVHSFDCYCYPPIYYEGWKEHLVHYAFILSPKRTVLPSFSSQNIDQVIELPIMHAKNGIIQLLDEQHPGFILDSQDSSPEFLEKGVLLK